MKKSDKEKAATIIVTLIVVIFLLLVTIGIKSRQVKTLDHYIACDKICHPNQVDLDKSKVFCHCLEGEENATQ